MFSLRYLSFSSIFIFVVIGCATSAIDDQTVALPTAADTGETPILARPSSTTPPTVSPTPSSTASPTFAPTSLLPNVTPSPTITPTLPITSSFRAIPYTETEWAKIIELQNIHWGLLSPDHTLIASAFIEETHVIDVATGNIKWIFEKDFAAVSGTNVGLFSPDSSLLIIAGAEEIVYVWNVITGELVYKFPFPIFISSADLTSDGRYLAVGNGGEGGGFIHVYDLAGGTWIEYSEQMFFGDIAFLPDSTVLAISRQGFNLEDGAILLWDFVSGAERIVLPVEGGGDFPPGYISGGYLNVSPSENLMSVEVNDSLHLWDTHSEVEIKLQESPFDNRIKRVLFSADGNFAIQGRDNSVTVWNSQGNLLGGIHGEVNSWIWFTPDGKYLVQFSLDHEPPLVWEMPDSP